MRQPPRSSIPRFRRRTDLDPRVAKVMSIRSAFLAASGDCDRLSGAAWRPLIRDSLDDEQVRRARLLLPDEISRLLPLDRGALAIELEEILAGWPQWFGT